MATVNILETKGLTKAFGGVEANREVDFTLPRGKITALIGPNGAGKSTFVGMICGRIPATRGQVFIEGQDVSTLPAHKRIQMGLAYTFQITSIFAGLSVFENVALSARRVNVSTAGIAQKVRDVLNRVGLMSRADQIAGTLSYGHQRLLEIAMGLAQNPRIFILDEPTQGLSEAEVTEFIALIRSLAGTSTVLLIEHNMNVVMKTADWITVFDQGELLSQGTPEQIRQDRVVQDAYLGVARDA